METLKNAGRLLTAEEYAGLPYEGERSDLVRGRVVHEPMPKYAHGNVQLVVGSLLRAHIRERNLPLVCLGPIGFVVERGPDTVRGPDIAVVRRDTPLLPIEWFEGVPGLVVEIRSPTNRAGKLKQKVSEYVAAGADLVWVIEPTKRWVEVHYPDGMVRRLQDADRLDGGVLMPDLDVRVAELFADL